MQYIILDGPEGGGHSTHAQHLTLSLRTMGMKAVAWTHPRHPDGVQGISRISHFIEVRKCMSFPETHDVVVMDRGPWSGVAHAMSIEAIDPRRLDSGLSMALSDAEQWSHAHMIYLDAPDHELDRRLTLRGEDPSCSWPERRAWRELASTQGWVSVDTIRLPMDTIRAITSHALCILK